MRITMDQLTKIKTEMVKWTNGVIMHPGFEILPAGALEKDDFDVWAVFGAVMRRRIQFDPSFVPLFRSVIVTLIELGAPPSNVLMDPSGYVHLVFRSSFDLERFSAIADACDELVEMRIFDEDQESILLGSLVTGSPIFLPLWIDKMGRRILDQTDDPMDLLWLYMLADQTKDVRIHTDGYLTVGEEDCGEEKEAAQEGAQSSENGGGTGDSAGGTEEAPAEPDSDDEIRQV